MFLISQKWSLYYNNECNCTPGCQCNSLVGQSIRLTFQNHASNFIRVWLCKTAINWTWVGDRTLMYTVDQTLLPMWVWLCETISLWVPQVTGELALVGWCELQSYSYLPSDLRYLSTIVDSTPRTNIVHCASFKPQKIEKGSGNV